MLYINCIYISNKIFHADNIIEALIVTQDSYTARIYLPHAVNSFERELLRTVVGDGSYRSDLSQETFENSRIRSDFFSELLPQGRRSLRGKKTSGKRISTGRCFDRTSYMYQKVFDMMRVAASKLDRNSGRIGKTGDTDCHSCSNLRAGLGTPTRIAIYRGICQEVLTPQNATSAEAAARCGSDPKALSRTTSVRTMSREGSLRPRCSFASVGPAKSGLEGVKASKQDTIPRDLSKSIESDCCLRSRLELRVALNLHRDKTTSGANFWGRWIDPPLRPQAV